MPAFFTGLLIAAASSTAQAQTLCVYDPAGRTGFVFDWMESYKLNAAGQGVTLELKPYTDEETAVNDFTAGKCDGVAATGVRLQKFNRAAYTLEALSGVPDYGMLKSVLNTVQTNSRYASMFTSGSYETAGVYPLGAVYAFVRDREINDITDFAGKRIAAMEYDATSLLVVERIGGVAVPVNLSSVSGTFNNGDAAATFLPASAYTPFELWHGLEGGGAVVKYPLLQVTMQIVINPTAFPAGYGTSSRAFVASQFDVAMQTVNKAEGEIKSSYWSTMAPDQVEEFERAMQRLRLELRDKGSYDADVLRLLRLARCNADSSRWECASPVE
ncbi:MAG: hypothetical protein ACI8RZ_002774 [Myxococcota bacterium]|jgi:hypothetical protein